VLWRITGVPLSYQYGVRVTQQHGGLEQLTEVSMQGRVGSTWHGRQWCQASTGLVLMTVRVWHEPRLPVSYRGALVFYGVLTLSTGSGAQ
jgi:hypothetical protein